MRTQQDAAGAEGITASALNKGSRSNENPINVATQSVCVASRITYRAIVLNIYNMENFVDIVRAIVSGSANVFTIILFTAMSYLGVGLLKCAIDECRKL